MPEKPEDIGRQVRQFYVAEVEEIVPQFPCELISWTEVRKLSLVLMGKFHKSRYRPDTIVAIARGGYVPARLLCDYMHITDLRSFRIAHYIAGAEKKKQAELVDPLCRDLEGRKILLVDDVSDTGATLEIARKHLVECNAGVIHIAVLHHKKISTVIPDFYGKRIVKWRWLIYPWALTEDLTGLIKRLSDPATNEGKLIKQLNINYGLRIRKTILREVESCNTSAL